MLNVCTKHLCSGSASFYHSNYFFISLLACLLTFKYIDCSDSSLFLGCEYGDKAPWCSTMTLSAALCNQGNTKDLCCSSCKKFKRAAAEDGDSGKEKQEKNPII